MKGVILIWFYWGPAIVNLYVILTWGFAASDFKKDTTLKFTLFVFQAIKTTTNWSIWKAEGWWRKNCNRRRKILLKKRRRNELQIILSFMTLLSPF